MCSRQRSVFAAAAIGIGLLSGCHDEPSATVAPEIAASIVPSSEGITTPILLENPYDGHPDYPPLTVSCAHQVNNEGAFSGWYREGSSGIDPQRWDRNGIAAPPWLNGSSDWPIDMNDRGQILVRNGGADPEFDSGWVYIWNADGFFAAPLLPTGNVAPARVRMNRAGAAIATYFDVSWSDEPPFRPMHYIVTSNLGTLVPPRDPWRRLPYNTPEAECVGEAIDDIGRIHAACSIEGQWVHYRWMRQDDATPIPGARQALKDVEIHHVNRYGEIAGSSPSGPVFWSPVSGRIDIPTPAGAPRLFPVAINDRGVVLLSSDHDEFETAYPARMIAYWTRARGTIPIPRGGWPFAAVRDINNQGVIAGCVADAGRALQAAYWRIY